jgi:hypothetical protein
MKALERCGAIIALAGLGCGGDSSDGRVDTGLPEASALRDVTSEQAASACENLRGAIETELSVDENVRAACELFGAALTETSADCQSQAETCVAQSEDGTQTFIRRDSLDFSSALECDGDVGDFEGCDVTVGEYERCMDARLTQVEQLFAQFSCGQAASIEISDAQLLVGQIGSLEPLDACERLQTECPAANPFPSGGN